MDGILGMRQKEMEWKEMGGKMERKKEGRWRGRRVSPRHCEPCVHYWDERDMHGEKITLNTKDQEQHEERNAGSCV